MGYSFKDTYLGDEFQVETAKYGGVEVTEKEEENAVFDIIFEKN